MSKKVEFFFDFVSPTCYLAQFFLPPVIERTGAELVLRPMFQGGVMHATGNRPPGTIVPKGKWLTADLRRITNKNKIPFYSNPYFPMNTRGLTRATLGLDDQPELRDAFVKAAFAACWGQEKTVDPASSEGLSEICNAVGLELEYVQNLAEDQGNKDKLRANTEEAVERGVFGAPSFFVGDELFFGHDRIYQIEDELNGLKF